MDTIPTPIVKYYGASAIGKLEGGVRSERGGWGGGLAIAEASSAIASEMLKRADFREGDEDSNFLIFEVWRFSEWPKLLH